MRQFIQDSPIGLWAVSTTEAGLLASLDYLGGSAGDARRIPETKTEKQIACMLDRYFHKGEPVDFHRLKLQYPASVPDRRFTVERTMRILQEIPFGETRSYRWLAERLGNAYASRAAGTMLRQNPIPVIVPCHRIIASNGDLGGFMGKHPDGLKIKRFLLNLEQAAAVLPV